MYDLAKMFLHCLNHWKLETPTAHHAHSPPSPMEDTSNSYKVNYMRYLILKSITIQWLVYCYVYLGLCHLLFLCSNASIFVDFGHD